MKLRLLLLLGICSLGIEGKGFAPLPFRPAHCHQVWTEHGYNKHAAFLEYLQLQQVPVPCDPIAVPSRSAVPVNFKKGCKVRGLRTKDFRGIGQNGIILNKPGVYRLCENVSFAPTLNNVQAITITSSNVILDLQGFTLSQNLNNYKTGVYGIAIGRDVTNVKITGANNVAQILDFTLAGIRVLGRTNVITIENVTVSQSAPRPLTNEVIPESCANLNCALITSGILIGEGEPVGLAFNRTNKNNHVTNLFLRNVNVKRCMIGAQIVMTFGFQIFNSTFTENTSNGLLLGFFLPIPGNLPNTFEFPVGANGVVQNCRFDRNVGDNAGITNPIEGNVATVFQLMGAIVLNEVQNVTIENSSVDDNKASSVLLTADHDAARNITWRNCTFNRNISTGSDCDGFHFSGSIPFTAGECVGIGPQLLQQDRDVVVEYCVAENNQGATNTSGFRFVYVNGARVADCNAGGNFATGGAATTISSGFEVDGDIFGGSSHTLTFLRCTSTRNGNEGRQGLTAGFTVRSVITDLIFRDCIAVANGNVAATSLSTGAGFLIAAGENLTPAESTQNITYDNAIASDNGSDSQTGSSGGIVIIAPPGGPMVQNVLIQNSTLTNNRNGLIIPFSITGLIVRNNEAMQNKVVGFDLAAVTNPALISGNVAYNPLGINYTGVPAANIITAPVGNLPDGTAVGFKNLSIID